MNFRLRCANSAKNLTIAFLILVVSLFCNAQSTNETDDSFDPFADYNEFEQQSEEESDINFLRNGRYLTLGFLAGYRGFIGGGFSQAYRGGLQYGAEFSYFFDLHLAATLGYLIGDHSVSFDSYTNEGFNVISQSYSGTVNIQVIDFHMKHYFNTDNVTKGLADLNPYLLLGTGYYVRTYNLNQSLSADPDRVVGFKVGGGIEIPMLRRQAYFGVQGVFRYVQFPDENKTFIDEAGGDPAGFRPIKPRLDGDIFEIMTCIGLNF